MIRHNPNSRQALPHFHRLSQCSFGYSHLRNAHFRPLTILATFLAMLITNVVAAVPATQSSDWKKIIRNTRQALRDVDPTNSNSSLRRHLAKNDPIERGKEKIYFEYRDRLMKLTAGRQPVSLSPDSIHYQRLVQARRADGTAIFQPADLAGVTLYFDVPLSRVLDASAVTLGETILFADSFSADDPALTILLAHELTHVMQVRRLGGERAFGRKYISQSVQQGIPAALSTCGSLDHRLDQAHTALDLEREAHANESAVAAWLSRDQ